MPTTPSALGGILAPSDADPFENGAAQMRSIVAQLDKLVKIKTANTVKNNSVALSTVGDMSFPVVAGQKYAFQYCLLMVATNATPDAVLGMSFPGGGASTCTWGLQGLEVGATSSIAQARTPGAVGVASDTTLSIGVPTNTIMVVLEGTLIAGASGTASLRFAQSVATAADVSILTGSKMRVEIAQ